MDPKEAKNEPHILDTKQLNPVFCNNLEKRKTEGAASEKLRSGEEDINWNTFGRKKLRTDIDVATVM